MYYVLWIFVGLVAGWLARLAMEGEGYGLLFDIAMGIGGALIGGITMRIMGFSGYAGTMLATLTAIAVALALTILVALGNGRRIRVRHL
jgi:uncharacterized membrane protein YeaQ/YmgE (transglycosylase-associated protein family)